MKKKKFYSNSRYCKRLLIYVYACMYSIRDARVIRSHFSKVYFLLRTMAWFVYFSGYTSFIIKGIKIHVLYVWYSYVIICTHLEHVTLNVLYNQTFLWWQVVIIVTKSSIWYIFDYMLQAENYVILYKICISKVCT